MIMPCTNGGKNMRQLYSNCLEVAKQITDTYRNFWWAAKDAVNKGTPPPPPVPDYSEATRESILSDIESLPARKTIEAAAKMGGYGSITIGGRTVDYDFRGISDLDQQVTDLTAAGRSAETMAGIALNIQKKYGADFASEALKRIEETDPVGFKVRKRLAEMTLAELEKGSSLSDSEVRFAEQSFRRATAARGGSMLGTSGAIQEALSQYNMGRQLLGDRMNMARSYVGMPQTAQMGQVAGAQQGAAPFMPNNFRPGLGINPNAQALGAQFASNVYGTQAGIYGAQLANQSDPFGAVLGGIAGIGMTAAGGALAGGLNPGMNWKEGVGSAFFGGKS